MEIAGRVAVGKGAGSGIGPYHAARYTVVGPSEPLSHEISMRRLQQRNEDLEGGRKPRPAVHR